MLSITKFRQYYARVEHHVDQEKVCCGQFVCGWGFLCCDKNVTTTRSSIEVRYDIGYPVFERVLNIYLGSST